MNCPKCNATLLPNARFCGACGLQMPTSQQSPSTMPSSPQMFQENQSPPQNSYGNQQTPNREAFHLDADGRGRGINHNLNQSRSNLIIVGSDSQVLLIE